jgi:hypothetical protein
MFPENVRLELSMENEQVYVMSYLRRKGMKRPAIVAELTAVDHEDVFNENRVKY